MKGVNVADASKQMPTATYSIQLEETRLYVFEGKSRITQHFVVTHGPFLGRRLRITLPISEVLGTVELEASDWTDLE
jgi:hypothetical protein